MTKQNLWKKMSIFILIIAGIILFKLYGIDKFNDIYYANKFSEIEKRLDEDEELILDKSEVGTYILFSRKSFNFNGETFFTLTKNQYESMDNTNYLCLKDNGVIDVKETSKELSKLKVDRYYIFIKYGTIIMINIVLIVSVLIYWKSVDSSKNKRYMS